MRVTGIVLIILSSVVAMASVGWAVFGYIGDFDSIATSPDQPSPSDLANRMGETTTTFHLLMAISFLMFVAGVITLVLSSVSPKNAPNDE